MVLADYQVGGIIVRLVLVPVMDACTIRHGMAKNGFCDCLVFAPIPAPVVMFMRSRVLDLTRDAAELQPAFRCIKDALTVRTCKSPHNESSAPAAAVQNFAVKKCRIFRQPRGVRKRFRTTANFARRHLTRGETAVNRS